MKPTALVLSFLAAPALAAAANVYWIPAVAHAAGSGGSLWRTSVAVRNLESTTTTVELRLHHSAGVATRSWEIGGGHQQLFEDVVARLIAGDVSGSLEIVSTNVVSVRSRTYNDAAAGTFGQGLDGVTAPAGLAAGATASLGALEETTAFRTNLGFLNMGTAPAEIDVTLASAGGTAIGAYHLSVPAGELKQDNRPFANRFGLTDLRGGSAVASLTSGGPIVAYASVVDNRTGDPTTIPMVVGEGCP